MSLWASYLQIYDADLIITLISPPPSAVGIYLFSILCILGSALFALGSHFNGTPYLLPLMLAGRLLLGAGSGSVVGGKANTFESINQRWLRGPFHSILCILLSFAGSHYSVLVQRQGDGHGLRGDHRFLSFGFRPEFLHHSEF